MEIKIKEAAPSLGKSHGAITHILESKKPFIIACISKHLCQQTEDKIKELAKDPVDVLKITSDEKFINGTFGKFVEEVEAGQRDIIIITHTCLAMSYKKGVDFSNWNLLIDEVPNEFVEVQGMNQLVEDELTMFLQYLVCIKQDRKGDWQKDTFRLKPNKKEDLERRLTYLNTSGDKTLNERIKYAYEYLLLGGCIQRCQEDTDKERVIYRFVKILQPKILLESFQSVTLIAANITETLVGQVWEKIFNISFIDTPDIKLLRDKIPNIDKVVIYPLLEESKNLSRYLLDKEDKEYGTLFDRLLDTGVNIFNKQPFLYVINEYRERKINNGIQVKVKAHGLNCYSDKHNVLSLFSYNPQPDTIDILQDLARYFNYPEETFVDAFIVTNYLENSFQVVTRTSIRKHESEDKVNIVVGDMRCVDYLKNKWFKEATVNTTYMYTPEDNRQYNKGRPPSFVKMLHMDKKEKAAFYRWKKTLGYEISEDNSNHKQIVKDWLLNRRKDG